MASELYDQVSPLIPDRADVLEVGCGGGQLGRMMTARRHDLRWTGLDLSNEQIARAQRRAANDDRVSFMVGDALALPFPDASFDALVSVGSIKHWPDQARGLSECVRALRPDGRLIVVEADRGCRYEDAARFVESWPIPRLFRPGSLAFFRTAVAGRSLDLEDARSLLQALDLKEWEARRLPGTPTLIMLGRK
jgi:SAM-dependent methyltransferase